MKSYWIVTHGDEARLERREVPVPQPKAGDVAIRVHASAFNRGELIVGGAVHGGPEKLGGNEASGEITAIGEGVSGWKVGDRVMARVRGGFAEIALAYAGQLMPMPSRLTWEEAAAIPSTFITAYEAVVQYGGLQRGEWLLVTGVSAGTGVASVLIAKELGARSIGTSGSAANLAKLKGIGLDAAINTRAPDFAAQVQEISGGNGVNLAVNLVGASIVPEILRSLSRSGRLAIVGYVNGTYHAEIDFEAVHVNRYHIFGISNAKLTLAERFETTRGFVRDILPAIVAGRISPVVDSVFSFDELPAARARMDAESRVGKVVVRVA